MSWHESAVVFTWHSVVTETMNRILNQDGSDLQWQPDHSDLPTDSTVCVCGVVHRKSSITFMLAVQSVGPPLQLLGGRRMPRDLHAVKLRVLMRNLTDSNS